jgi:putative chitinase
MSRTLEGLRALGPNGKKKFIDAIAAVADEVLSEYDIDTPLRVSHFWAQASHECAGFKTMHEYWGPTKAQLGYEGRKDLGNIQPGDGYRFRGRGIFQLTGRHNYAAMSKKIGIDLLANPELAADPKTALRIACEYWKSRGLNKWADANDIKAITKRINGGFNGLADRKANFVIAWRIWGGGVDRPAPKPLTKSTEMAAGGAAATGGTIGVGAAFEVGKEAARNAQDVKEAVNDAGTMVGFDGSMALLVGAFLIFALGVGYLLVKRYRRNRTEEV